MIWIHKINGIYAWHEATLFQGTYHVPTYATRTPSLRIGTSMFIPAFFELTEYHRDKIEWMRICALPFFEREAALKLATPPATRKTIQLPLF